MWFQVVLSDKAVFMQSFKKPGLPCGTVNRNLPANAGNTGLIPGPGRFHMPSNN